MRDPERAVAGPFLLAAFTAPGIRAVTLLAHTVVTDGPARAARLVPHLAPLTVVLFTGIATAAVWWRAWSRGGDPPAGHRGAI